ncbi:ASCH domain-containing protein [Mucilaginibacter gossypii]|uniref:ASCH domain-containing protein n=1 Tax=Mucilaginibacter gossypii TaxID=551996 RepID=UPI000DCE5F01|nr:MULTISPECIES: ASCH domain-containing protein [Mucilaginibacter]QTE37508.1 ASCH domain-containing protein [Mucilaginibacter gossypii]RAV52334.1 hypothetical protein DIU36_24680 [Mucilaginibacter rubeus]
MKALSVKQPWAALIVSGIKDIENRTWKTNFRGRVYIHASQKPVDEIQELLDMLSLNIKTAVEQFNYSAIIGEVDIVDCVQNHPSLWAENGVWNWVLANPVKYETPILNVKGGLSFWKYNPTTNL